MSDNGNDSNKDKSAKTSTTKTKGKAGKKTDQKSASTTPTDLTVKSAHSQKANQTDSNPKQEKNQSTPVEKAAFESGNKKTNKKNAKPTPLKPESPLFAAKAAPKLNAPKKSTRFNIVGIVIAVLLLLILAILGWTSYSQYQIKQDWQATQTELQQQINQQQQKNQNSQQAATNGLNFAQSNSAQINQQAAHIKQLEQALTATQQRIKELSGRRQQDWMLAEAEYLINLAEYKVSLQRDQQTAIALLKTADEKIALIGDNSLLDLRSAIAKDIANLQLIVNPDISGIAARIDSLSEQVKALNILALEFKPIAERISQQPKDSQQAFSWGEFFKEVSASFVTVKHHDQPAQPLMTPSQRGNLNANLQLVLQQAQIALLQGEQSMYQRNLTKAATWVEQFFQADTNAQQMQQALTELKQIRITADLPRQLNAKQEITQINQQRLYQWLESPTSSALENDVEPQ
jgi:uroporphyrin-III C-methyltransferase